MKKAFLIMKITIAKIRYLSNGSSERLCEDCHEEVMNYGNVYRDCNLPRCDIFLEYCQEPLNS